MVLKKKKKLSSGGSKPEKSSGTKKKFVYSGRGRTSEDVEKAARESGGNFDALLKGNIPTYKVKDGENNIRILPTSWEDTKKWGRNWYIAIDVHYGVGADRQSYLCLKMNDEDCPVCAARQEAEDEDDKKQLRANRRALCYVIDRDNEKAGVMAWAMPLTLSKDISGRSNDKKTGQPILIDDPEAGFDVSFVAEGKDVQRKYSRVELAREATPLHDNEKRAEKWLDFIASNSLPDMLQFFDEEHISGVLTGTKSRKDEENEDESEDDEENEGEEEDDTPRRKRKAGKGKSKSRDDEEDEDGDEEESEDDEGEESEDDEEGGDDEDEGDGDGDEESEDEDESEDEEGDGDEEGDEEEEGEDDEEEDDPPPRRKAGKGKAGKSKSKKGDDDDDDEDEDEDEGEDEDDEEEDEAPKKGKSAAERARARIAEAKKKRKK